MGVCMVLHQIGKYSKLRLALINAGCYAYDRQKAPKMDSTDSNSIQKFNWHG